MLNIKLRNKKRRRMAKNQMKRPNKHLWKSKKNFSITNSKFKKWLTLSNFMSIKLFKFNNNYLKLFKRMLQMMTSLIKRINSNRMPRVMINNFSNINRTNILTKTMKKMEMVTQPNCNSSNFNSYNRCNPCNKTNKCSISRLININKISGSKWCHSFRTSNRWITIICKCSSSSSSNKSNISCSNLILTTPTFLKKCQWIKKDSRNNFKHHLTLKLNRNKQIRVEIKMEDMIMLNESFQVSKVLS